MGQVEGKSHMEVGKETVGTRQTQEHRMTPLPPQSQEGGNRAQEDWDRTAMGPESLGRAQGL